MLVNETMPGMKLTVHVQKMKRVQTSIAYESVSFQQVMLHGQTRGGIHIPCAASRAESTDSTTAAETFHLA